MSQKFVDDNTRLVEWVLTETFVFGVLVRFIAAITFACSFLTPLGCHSCAAWIGNHSNSN